MSEQSKKERIADLLNNMSDAEINAMHTLLQSVIADDAEDAQHLPKASEEAGSDIAESLSSPATAMTGAENINAQDFEHTTTVLTSQQIDSNTTNLQQAHSARETQPISSSQSVTQSMEDAGNSQAVTLSDDARESKIVTKRSKHTLLKASIVGLLCAGIVGGVYYSAREFTSTHFRAGTYINGKDVSQLSIERAKEYLTENLTNEQFTIYWKDGQSESIPLSSLHPDISFYPSIEALAEPSDWITYFGLGKDETSSYNVTYTLNVSQDNILPAISILNCVQGVGTTEPSDAYIGMENGYYTILQDNSGTRVDPDKLAAAISSALYNGDNSVELAEVDCYIDPNVNESDPSLKAILEKANRIQNYTLTLDMDGQDEVLDWNTVRDWTTFDGEDFNIDPGYVSLYVQDLAAKYDTLNTVRPFTTADGEQVNVGGGKLDCYGYQLDQKETAQLIEQSLSSLRSDTIKPVWIQEGVEHGSVNDFGNTYVEVSIEKQHLWYIQDGEVILETDVVTGMDNDERRTPTSVYMVLDVKQNYTMNGSYGSADCKYFIALSHDGIALHDASWRSSFGGVIYKDSGSHGCVNMPESAIAKLYPLVKYGMPVIVY